MTGLFLPPATAPASPLRVVDPRVKILTVVVLSVLIIQAAAGDIIFISLFLGLLIRLSGASPREIGRALKPIAVFTALLFLLHLFFTPGRALFFIPGLKVSISREGLTEGALVAWRFGALVTAGALLTITTPPSELVAALEKLLRPLRALRIPVQDLAIMAAMALRFTPTFLEEYHRMKAARLARGGGLPGESLPRRLRTAMHLGAAIILSAFRRAEDLAAAMEARGYARGPRTSLREMKLRRGDYTAAAVMVSFTGLIIAVRLLM
ncbi:MAG TPA: energy-coupling factor transporter transmembrane component T [Syntrophales bacterium]|jgi:energy-coupling factor transporter transmembrane protein EcfT|nr:energy-coupling factor transporter transmembrane component T [Syntrophales bacterium]HON23997.1 energy-coupling factor transporter transmembrane component T [Syntrophales bacterium]HOU78701.1 energy-coupling factor transporter transmembrane component T [Syntrophales bacterium]HPC33738.1 energy-coupling factor transporter transmembrane component T [Syntrophales bacterium]HQG35031.1 energy-coupling factor transporter transmembrane component T [Syntrophales bacterium]